MVQWRRKSLIRESFKYVLRTLVVCEGKNTAWERLFVMVSLIEAGGVWSLLVGQDDRLVSFCRKHPESKPAHTGTAKF